MRAGIWSWNRDSGTAGTCGWKAGCGKDCRWPTGRSCWPPTRADGSRWWSVSWAARRFPSSPFRRPTRCSAGCGRARPPGSRPARSPSSAPAAESRMCCNGRPTDWFCTFSISRISRWVPASCRTARYCPTAPATDSRSGRSRCTLDPTQPIWRSAIGW